MPPYCCFLCKKSNEDLLSVFYQNGHSAIKDDIGEICGFAYIKDLLFDDAICVHCAQVIDNMVRLKNHICEVIVGYVTNRDSLHRSTNKALNLQKIWNTSSTSSYYDDIEPASPDNLLIATSSVSYRDRPDDYDDYSPELDEEVQHVNGSRRRRRGYNWTKPKGGRRSTRSRSRSRSSIRSSRSSNNSRISRSTTASKRQIAQKQAEETHLKHIVGDFLAQNNSLSQFARIYLKKFNDYDCDLDTAEEEDTAPNNIVIKSRFAKELRKNLLEEYHKLVHVCTLCTETFWSLEELTEHRVKTHNETARFVCTQCNFDYLTQEHLDRHIQSHYENFVAYCIYCFDEFRDKKLYDDHLNEHIIHSFPCIYCDRYFLNKQRCDIHIREQHPGRKRKIKRIKPQSILDRIDKDPDKCYDDDSSETAGYVVKVLLQEKPEKELSIREDNQDNKEKESAVKDQWLELQKERQERREAERKEMEKRENERRELERRENERKELERKEMQKKQIERETQRIETEIRNVERIEEEKRKKEEESKTETEKVVEEEQKQEERKEEHEQKIMEEQEQEGSNDDAQNKREENRERRDVWREETNIQERLTENREEELKNGRKKFQTRKNGRNKEHILEKSEDTQKEAEMEQCELLDNEVKENVIEECVVPECELEQYSIEECGINECEVQECVVEDCEVVPDHTVLQDGKFNQVNHSVNEDIVNTSVEDPKVSILRTSTSKCSQNESVIERDDSIDVRECVDKET